MNPGPNATKYIFVTGGVVSSLGKGIAAASLGRLLVERGLNVTMPVSYTHLTLPTICSV